jgi:hypothetical protein
MNLDQLKNDVSAYFESGQYRPARDIFVLHGARQCCGLSAACLLAGRTLPDDAGDALSAIWEFVGDHYGMTQHEMSAFIGGWDWRPGGWYEPGDKLRDAFELGRSLARQYFPEFPQEGS